MHERTVVPSNVPALHASSRWFAALLFGVMGAGSSACTPGGGTAVDGGSVPVDGGSVPACTTSYAVARRRPEIVLLVDRSCAMRARIDAPAELASGPEDPRGRWAAVRDAIGALTPAAHASGWGLVLYPDDAGSCGEPAMRVEPGPGSAEEVALQLATGALDPFDVCGAGSEVPLEGALVTAGVSEALGATGEPFVVVIASGAPSCGSTTDSLVAASALTTELSTQIVVIALGPEVDGEPMLEALAAAGGAPAPGPPSYYSASSSDELRDLLEGLIAVRASCVLDLVGGPPSSDPEQLDVWVDGTLVEPSPDEGWSLSAGDDSIALNGTLCERLRAGELRRIEAAVGCDEPECVARDETCDSLDDDCDGVVDEDCL